MTERQVMSRQESPDQVKLSDSFYNESHIPTVQTRSSANSYRVCKHNWLSLKNIIQIGLTSYILGYEYESQNWDSDEVPATERDLADDAPWKQIQVMT